MIIPAPEWVHKLIGLKWVAGGRGPDVFDCWGLLQHVQREQFGIHLNDENDLVPKDLLMCCRFGEAYVTSNKQWHQVKRPQHGDVVAMSRGKRVHHVGVFLEYDRGIVLHAMDFSDVIASTINELRMMGLNTILFYRHESRVCKSS